MSRVADGDGDVIDHARLRLLRIANMEHERRDEQAFITVVKSSSKFR
jgi:hypothetical protein